MEKRTLKIIYWGITILFAAFMLLSGVLSLTVTPEGNKVMSDLGYPFYMNTILGVAKILGVVALLQTNFNTLKEWAYAGFVFDIIGATLSFALNGDPLASSLFMLPFLIVVFASYVLWKKAYN